jgi:hypothetical protein
MANNAAYGPINNSNNRIKFNLNFRIDANYIIQFKFQPTEKGYFKKDYLIVIKIKDTGVLLSKYTIVLPPNITETEYYDFVLQFLTNPGSRHKCRLFGNPFHKKLSKQTALDQLILSKK